MEFLGFIMLSLLSLGRLVLADKVCQNKNIWLNYESYLLYIVSYWSFQLGECPVWHFDIRSVFTSCLHRIRCIILWTWYSWSGSLFIAGTVDLNLYFNYLHLFLMFTLWISAWFFNSFPDVASNFRIIFFCKVLSINATQ